jgi:uncharacterized protein (TIGR02453 family)
METFTRLTFRYFDQAYLQGPDDNAQLWFEKNRTLYEEHVAKPTHFLLTEIKKSLSKLYPALEVNPKRFSRPIRRQPDKNGHIIRSGVQFLIAEKSSSRFEFNPGFYFSLGAQKEDMILGVGLYLISNRQTQRLRHAIFSDFATLDKILTQKSLKSLWKGLQGETYQRFPKGFDPEAPYAKYLKFKRFHLSQPLTRTAVIKKTFIPSVIQQFTAAIDFLHWVRTAVGTYKTKL